MHTQLDELIPSEGKPTFVARPFRDADLGFGLLRVGRTLSPSPTRRQGRDLGSAQAWPKSFGSVCHCFSRCLSSREKVPEMSSRVGVLAGFTLNWASLSHFDPQGLDDSARSTQKCPNQLVYTISLSGPQSIRVSRTGYCDGGASGSKV